MKKSILAGFMPSQASPPDGDHALIANSATAAETGKLTPLRLAYSAITVNQAIPWIAYDAGHFKKHGLDVELVHASSILALQALLAGRSSDRSIGHRCLRQFESERRGHAVHGRDPR